MATPRPDRRIERTRAALLQALVGLLLDDGVESITVAAVAARANVGRSTFYTHFRSRDDILRASLTMPSLPLAGIVTKAVDPGALLPLLDHFRQQRRLVRAFADGSLRKLWVRCLADLIERDLAPIARRLRVRPLLPIPLVAVQVAELQIALVVHGLSSREPLAPEALAEALIAVTRATVGSLLQCDATALLQSPQRIARRAR